MTGYSDVTNAVSLMAWITSYKDATKGFKLEQIKLKTLPIPPWETQGCLKCAGGGWCKPEINPRVWARNPAHVSVSHRSSIPVLRRGGCPAWILVQSFSWGLLPVYLEKNVCAHRFSMGYYWFLVFTFAIPTVQLDTPGDPWTTNLVFH